MTETRLFVCPGLSVVIHTSAEISQAPALFDPFPEKYGVAVGCNERGAAAGTDATKIPVLTSPDTAVEKMRRAVLGTKGGER
jgi:hypothetical protein